jgi:hypothetical protein
LRLIAGTYSQTGGIGIHPPEDVRHRSAEIGYWFSASCRGHGNATDAVRFRLSGDEKITSAVFLWLTGASLSAEVTDDELVFRKYLTRRTIATDRFYF